MSRLVVVVATVCLILAVVGEPAPASGTVYLCPPFRTGEKCDVLWVSSSKPTFPGLRVMGGDRVILSNEQLSTTYHGINPVGIDGTVQLPEPSEIPGLKKALQLSNPSNEEPTR